MIITLYETYFILQKGENLLYFNIFFCITMHLVHQKLYSELFPDKPGDSK